MEKTLNITITTGSHGERYVNVNDETVFEMMSEDEVKELTIAEILKYWKMEL